MAGKESETVPYTTCGTAVSQPVGCGNPPAPYEIGGAMNCSLYLQWQNNKKWNSVKN